MTKSYHTPRKSQMNSRRSRLWLWLILIVVVFSIGLTIGFFRTEAPQKDEVVKTAPVVEETRNIVLYFAAADGQSLVAESRDIQACADEIGCLVDTVKELLVGPQDEDLAAVFPQQVTINNVLVEDSLVKVDFSQELVSAHPGGTQSEMLTVYGLVDTLSVNFPHLRQVEIQVDGVPLETLKGHIDLRRPVVPDFSLVEEGAVPIGLAGDQPVERGE